MMDFVNDDELLQTVTLAASQIPEQLKLSTARLKVLLDTQPGTYNALQRIAADSSQPLQVRQQCIIQLKNAVLSHWRSRKYVPLSPALSHSLPDHFFRLLSEDDRTQIRHRCFTFLTEPDATVRPYFTSISNANPSLSDRRM